MAEGSFRCSPMNGGEDSKSYFRNSGYQKEVIDAAKELIRCAISSSLDLEHTFLGPSSSLLRIADLGCSVGPNTFIAVNNIIEAIKLKYKSEDQYLGNIEFQVFFNDQSDNDFNILFKNLPVSRPHFSAAVPGSFYARLFPKSSIHLVHSSYALHWLSKVPEEVFDNKSTAWNGGSIRCTGLVKEVAKAYAAQYKKDINAFLKARAEEVVPGGLVVILAPGLQDSTPRHKSWKGSIEDLIRYCLDDMVNSGLIDVDKVETLNFPIYYPYAYEWKEVIEENGCFNIEKLDIVGHDTKHRQPPSNEFVISTFRAVYEGIINVHFGNGIGDQVFRRVGDKLAKCPASFRDRSKDIDFFISLKRNSHRVV